MREYYEYKGYTIRVRQLASGEQWQVVAGRTILSRHDTKRDARRWVRQILAD